MIRYLHQRDHYSCGPVAIINAIKWAGGRATRSKHLTGLQEMCDCGADRGTSWFNFDRVLRQVMRGRVDVVRKFNPAFKQVSDHAKRDDGCVVVYCWPFRDISGSVDCGVDCHFSLVVDSTRDSFIAVNDSRMPPAVIEKPKWQWRREHMAVAKPPRGSGVPQVWFLTKLDV